MCPLLGKGIASFFLSETGRLTVLLQGGSKDRMSKCTSGTQHSAWPYKGGINYNCCCFYIPSDSPTDKAQKENCLGNTLVVQWLEFCTSTAEGMGLILDQGSKIQQAMWQKKKKERKLIIISQWGIVGKQGLDTVSLTLGPVLSLKPDQQSHGLPWGSPRSLPTTRQHRCLCHVQCNSHCNSWSSLVASNRNRFCLTQKRRL